MGWLTTQKESDPPKHGPRVYTAMGTKVSFLQMHGGRAEKPVAMQLG